MKIIISVGGAAVALVAVGAIAYAKGKHDGLAEVLTPEQQIEHTRSQLRRLLQEHHKNPAGTVIEVQEEEKVPVG